MWNEMDLGIPSGVIFKSKQEFVYQVLHNSIMNCQLLPGEKLIIQEIADQLSVSAIPVREALRLLASEDLVEYNAHTGAIVSRISEDSITETFTIKEALETASVRVAALKVTESDLLELTSHLKRMDTFIKEEKFKEWALKNSEFHMKITAISGMPLLKEMLNRVLNKWDRIRKYFFSEVVVYRDNQSQSEHWALLQALEKGDIDEAERLTKKHNRDALEFYMNYFRNGDRK
jgi:DNA-binding GntR family transcriptional regulator